MESRRLKKSVVYVLYGVGFIVLVGIAYLLEGVFTSNKLKEDEDEITYVNSTIFDETIPVVANDTKIIKPYTDPEITVLKDYYDYQADETAQQKSIIVYDKTYLQSSGVSYGGKDDFDVVSILDGTVISVKEDDLLGTVVEIKHDNNIISVYQSLKDVTVKENDIVTQGQIIAKAGTNNLSKDLGTHLYFELIIDGKIVNPQNYYDKTLNEL